LTIIALFIYRRGFAAFVEKGELSGKKEWKSGKKEWNEVKGKINQQKPRLVD
jgi:hypothetical protein